jgi:uncharacterized protein (TIGR03790 family)
MCRRLFPSALLMLLAASPAFAQSGANILIVVNDTSPDGARIAAHYARVRNVPPDQVCRLKVDPADEVDHGTFNAQIQQPIAAWLRGHAAQDRILYIVLTRGVPLRVAGTGGRDGTTASVDSELALLYRRLAGEPVAVEGRIANPYFLGDAPIDQAKPFSRSAFDLYLVTRLDGFTAADAEALIDRAAAPARDGRILLDQKAGLIDWVANEWLAAAAARLSTLLPPSRVVLETTSKVLDGQKNVLGYYSWGSNDWAVTSRHAGLGFVPGAIAGSYVNTDGRTFAEPPASWTLGKWSDRATFFGGSPQSLAGDLIRAGVTGVSASVAEPYLDGMVRPDVLFPAYVRGFNLAEAYYLATPYLSWQTIIVGDPLCAPFPRTPVPAGDIDGGLDAESELPVFLAARRLRVITAQGAKPDAAKAILRSEARTARGDADGATRALEEAAAIDPSLVGVQLALASAYEVRQEYERAIERYRAVLVSQPDSIVALNNLAYALAVRKASPQEALPIAERAMRLSGGRSAAVADTLAWVQHLLGQDAEAARLLDAVVKGAPAGADVRLHAAVVFAQVGRLDEARAQLEEALKLDPALGSSEEVKALRMRLK